jgi:hypothetical protein
MEMLKKLLIAKTEKEQGDMHSYLKMLEKGSFKDVFNFGIAEATRGFLLVNPLTDPGALYCGGMGSGKSQAMKFTLITHLIANSRNTIYLLYDGFKGMADYKIMFDLKDNVAYAINDPSKIVPIIDMVHGEMMARKEEFAKYNASSIKEYDTMMLQKDPNYKGLARIVLAMEEFHSIPNSEYVKFAYLVDNPGSVANQMKELMRVGRSYGLTLIAATQRAVSDDFPSTLKPGISQMMAFRVTNPNDVSALGLTHAQDIRQGMSGRCAYQNGFIQFPYFGDTDAVPAWLIKKYYKPLEAKTLKYSINDFHKAFSGEGNDGVLLVKPFKDIVNNAKQFNHIKIAERFLKSFNFKVEDQKNEAFMCNFIAERDGIKYAGLVITNSSTMSSEKAAQSFKEAQLHFNADSVIAICVDKQISSYISKFVNSVKGIVVDNEDLLKIAAVLDNREKVDLPVFEKMLSTLVLAKKPQEKVETKPKSDLDDDDDDIDLDELANFGKKLT